MIIPDEFFILVDRVVFFEAENKDRGINCEKHGRLSNKTRRLLQTKFETKVTKKTLILPKASSMTGDMRKVAVTRVAATRMKSSAPLVTITLARSVLSGSDLKKTITDLSSQ